MRQSPSHWAGLQRGRRSSCHADSQICKRGSKYFGQDDVIYHGNLSFAGLPASTDRNRRRTKGFVPAGLRLLNEDVLVEPVEHALFGELAGQGLAVVARAFGLGEPGEGGALDECGEL